MCGNSKQKVGLLKCFLSLFVKKVEVMWNCPTALEWIQRHFALRHRKCHRFSVIDKPTRFPCSGSRPESGSSYPINQETASLLRNKAWHRISTFRSTFTILFAICSDFVLQVSVKMWFGPGLYLIWIKPRKFSVLFCVFFTKMCSPTCKGAAYLAVSVFVVSLFVYVLRMVTIFIIQILVNILIFAVPFRNGDLYNGFLVNNSL